MAGTGQNITIRAARMIRLPIFFLAGYLALTGCGDVIGPDVPDPPHTLRVEAASVSSVVLNWVDNSDDETGFVIELNPPGPDGFQDHTTVEAGVTTFVVTDLDPNENYSYRVHAINEQGASDPSLSIRFMIYGINVGNIAEDFSALNHNNAMVSLYSYEGNVILLNFAASW